MLVDTKKAYIKATAQKLLHIDKGRSYLKISHI